MRVSFKCLTFVLFFMSLLVSCSDEKEPVKEETNLEMFNDLDIFDEKGAAQTVAFSAPTVWMAQTDQNWCTVTPDKGNAGMNTVKISVQPTSDYDERNASLTIISGSSKKTMTITQKQKDALLLTSSKKEVTSEGGIIEVEVKSNVNFVYSIDNNAVDWIVPIADRGLNAKTYRFKVKSNEQDKKREGIIVFSNDNLREEFHVYQQGTTPELILTQNVYNVSDEGENIRVELQSNFDYDIKMPDVDWVKEMGTRSLSTYTHYFTVSQNKTYENRTAKIEFIQKETGVSETVTINQNQRSDILIEKSEYTFEAEGGLLTLDVQSNIDFSVISEEPWIVQRKTKGMQKSQFLFDVSQNKTVLTREGIITVKSDQVTKKVKVVQKGNPDYAIKLVKGLLPFGSKSETQEMVIKTMENWKLYNKSTWVHVSPHSGAKGEHAIQVQVDPIPAVAKRVDSIYISAGKSQYTVPVIQNNQDSLMILTPDAHVGGLRDTIISVLVRSSYDVKFDIDEADLEWIVSIPTRSSTTKEFKFKILRSNEAEERVGKIHFTIGENKRDYLVTQDGIGLKMIVPTERYDFDDQARDFDITVEANFEHRPWFPDNVHLQYLKSEKLSSSNGMTKTKHYFHVDQNLSLYPQTYTIFYLDKKTGLKSGYFLKVLQENRNAINFSQTWYEVSSFGSKIDVEVQSNVKYTMKPDQSWIKLLNQTSKDKAIIYQFEIAPNQSLEERKGSIVFAFGESKKYVNITQEGYSDFGVLVTDSLKTFTSAGATQDLGFRASDKWTVSCSDQDWCTVSPTSGDKGDVNKIKVTAAANKTYDNRKAVLTFKCGKHTQTVPVEQMQVDHVEFPHTAYTAAWNQTSLDVIFKANCSYKVTVNQPWVKEVPKSKGLVDKKVSFTLEKNTGDHPREAVLTFTYLNKKQNIKLTQKCMDSLEVVNPTHTVSGKNDTIVKIKVNTTGEVQCKIEGDASKWIKLLESRALLEKEFTFKVSKSFSALERKGVITFVNGNKKATGTITQKGVGLLMEYEHQKQIDNKAQRVELIVNSNFQYKTLLDGSGLIQELPVQVLPSEKEGFITKKHTFVVPQNETLEARNFDFIFVNTEYIKEFGEDKSHKFRIAQMGTNTIFVTNGTEYSIPEEGKTIEVDVTSNVKYQVKVSDPSWIEQVTKTKGVESTKLNFNIHKNQSTKPRKGTITLSGQGCETVVTINQAAFNDYGIVINEGLKKFETEGGEQVLKFNSSLDWVASSTEPWCTFNVTKGTAGKNKEITVKVAPSTEKTDRKATIVLMAGVNHKQTVEVIQRQKDYIDVPAEIQNVGWEKKQVTLNVKSNCDYKVNYTEDWIKTIKQDRNALVLEVAESNQIQPREAKLTLVYEDIQKEITIKQAGAPASIEITSGDVKAPWQGSVEEVAVKANCPYEFKSNADWVKADKSDKGLKLTVSENPNPKGRNTTVTLTYGKLQKDIKVEQEPKSTLEILTPTKDLTVSPAKGTLVVKVKANTNYKIGFSNNWINEVSHSATEIVLSYNENPLFEERHVTVQLSSENESISFVVTQEAQIPQLTIDAENKTIDSDATKVSMGVSSNVEYTIDIATQKEDGNWLTGPTSNKGALELDATKNLTLKTRTAQVTLKSKVGSIERKVTVTQKAAQPSIAVNPATINVDSKAQDKKVNVTANCDYTIESKADWVSGEKNAKGDVVTLAIKENYAINSRNAAVTLRYKDITSTIVINQEAGTPVEIKVIQPKSIAWDMTKVPVEVTANSAYNVTVETGDWLTAPTGLVETSTPLVLTATKNDTYEPRAASVKLTAEGLTKPVVFTVVQNAKVSAITVADKAIGADDTSCDLIIKSNCKYTVKVTEGGDWLTAVTTSGTAETATLKFTASKNSGVTPRTATVTITSDDNKVQTVKITQAGAVASIKVTKGIEGKVAPEGGTIELTVDANCAYDISVTGENSKWLTPKSPKGNKGTTTVGLIATRNENTKEGRTATVNFIYGGKVISHIDITQDKAAEPAPDPEPAPAK